MDLIDRNEVLGLLEKEWAKYHGDCPIGVLYNNIVDIIKNVRKVMTTTVYLAAPIVGISEEDKEMIANVKECLEYEGYAVYDPREHGVPNAWGMSMDEWGRSIFSLDAVGIQGCEWVVVCDFGRDMKAGTAWECGYAFGIGKQIFLIQMKEETDYSVMLRGCSTTYCTYDEFINIPLEGLFGRRGEQYHCDSELN